MSEPEDYRTWRVGRVVRSWRHKGRERVSKVVRCPGCGERGEGPGVAPGERRAAPERVERVYHVMRGPLALLVCYRATTGELAGKWVKLDHQEASA